MLNRKYFKYYNKSLEGKSLRELILKVANREVTTQN